MIPPGAGQPARSRHACVRTPERCARPAPKLSPERRRLGLAVRRAPAMDKVGFLDSSGLGVLVGGLNRVRAHDGSLDLVCTQKRILTIFKITGLTKVFGIHQTLDQAIAAKKGRR